MHEAGDLCGLCGAVLEGHAADGVVRLEDEAAARGLDRRCCVVGARGRWAERVLCGDAGLEGLVVSYAPWEVRMAGVRTVAGRASRRAMDWSSHSWLVLK